MDAVFLVQGDPGAFLFSLTFVILVANLAIVGGLLASRRPDNPIGWLLLTAGLFEGIGIAGSIYARLDALFGGGRFPLVVPAAWLGSWIVPPAIGILVIFLPIIFPSGHLPGPRWRFFVAFAIVAMTIGMIASATAPGPLDNIDGIANPVVLPAPLGDWVQVLGQVSQATAVFGFLVAVGSLVLRFRRSRGIERQQLKWFLFVASISATCLAVSIVTVTGPISDSAWILGLVTMAFVPIAIGVAVLRYRLYEIDRIVSQGRRLRARDRGDRRPLRRRRAGGGGAARAVHRGEQPGGRRIDPDRRDRLPAAPASHPADRRPPVRPIDGGRGSCRRPPRRSVARRGRARRVAGRRPANGRGHRASGHGADLAAPVTNSRTQEL